MALPFQTATLSEYPDSYMVGQIISARPGDVMTARCEIADLPPGIFVVLDETDTPGQGEPYRLRLPAAAGDIGADSLWGVVALDDTYENQSDGTFTYQSGDTVPILVRGRIAVEPEDALAPGVFPFVRHTATPPEQAGAIRSDADGTDAVALTHARTLTSMDTGVPGVLEIF